MKKKRFFFLLALIGHLATGLKAQQPDTLAPPPATPLVVAHADTMLAKPGFFKRIFTKNYPNPGTAVLLSLALPGAGQAYNKKWWKLPIVYGVLGFLTYTEIDNIKQYNLLKDNHKWVVDGDPNTNPFEAPYNLMDGDRLKFYRDQWRSYVELNSLALGIAYILTATEAYVDAHLAHFDVSDDLSLRIRPSLQPAPDNGVAFGLGFALQIGR
ncbi:MAG: DUF5683 domain-containing protein [Saprospiraceae bacterium]